MSGFRADMENRINTGNYQLNVVPTFWAVAAA